MKYSVLYTFTHPVPPRGLGHDDDLDGAGAVLAGLGTTYPGFSGPWQTARGNKTAYGQHIARTDRSKSGGWTATGG